MCMSYGLVQAVGMVRAAAQAAVLLPTPTTPARSSANQYQACEGRQAALWCSGSYHSNKQYWKSAVWCCDS